MTKHRFFAEHAADHAGFLATDATVRNVAAMLKAGTIAKPAAIEIMREAGACEPEIVEALSC